MRVYERKHIVEHKHAIDDVQLYFRCIANVQIITGDCLYHIISEVELHIRHPIASTVVAEDGLWGRNRWRVIRRR